MESQSEDDDFNINTCSDDESIIGRMFNDKKSHPSYNKKYDSN